MKLADMSNLLTVELPKVKGITDKSSGKTYLRGENPYMDMQIENYIVCPFDDKNWHGFNKSGYELIYN